MARRVLPGVGVSPGIGIGKCIVVKEGEDETQKRKGSPSRRNASREAKRFEEASEHVKRELQEIKVKTDRDAGTDAAAIFEAQLLILEDPLFTDEVKGRISSENLPAEDAVRQTADSLRRKFSSLTSEYIRERAEDVRDVSARVLDALQGKNAVGALVDKTKRVKGGKVVLVSASLTPSTIAQFNRNMLAGIVTETGSTTSHLTIVARSLRIPAVLRVRGATNELRENEVAIVDGDSGQVIVNPSDIEASKYQNDMTAFGLSSSRQSETVMSLEPTKTVDGRVIQVFGNVGDLEGVKDAARYGAEGIGLFRTEFLYLSRNRPPNEDELFNVVKEASSIMKNKTIIVRTLDIGADKRPRYLEFPAEKNPALGLRGTRYCLANPSLFKTQISAILRANETGNIWIMLPMISTVQEVKKARTLIEEVKEELEQRKKVSYRSIKIGVMVETPSAALISDKLADEVDFFSIGTNDLAQYALAADRENENLSSIADPLEPSVLKLIYQTIDNGHLGGRHVGMCGEMAADPDAIPVLLGMGLDEFSVDPSNMQKVKKALRTLRYEETKKTIEDILRLESAAEVREFSRKKLGPQ